MTDPEKGVYERQRELSHPDKNLPNVCLKFAAFFLGEMTSNDYLLRARRSLGGEGREESRNEEDSGVPDEGPRHLHRA